MSTEIFQNSGFLAVLGVLILVFLCMATTTALRIRREVKENKLEVEKAAGHELVDLEANRGNNNNKNNNNNNSIPRTGNNSTHSLPKSSNKSGKASAASSIKGPKFGINALHQDHAQNGIPMTPTARPGPDFRDSQRSSVTMSPNIFISDDTGPLAQGSSSPRYPPRPYCSSVEDVSMSPTSCTSSCFAGDTSLSRSDPRSDRTPPRPQRSPRAR